MFFQNLYFVSPESFWGRLHYTSLGKEHHFCIRICISKKHSFYSGDVPRIFAKDWIAAFIKPAIINKYQKIWKTVMPDRCNVFTIPNTFCEILMVLINNRRTLKDIILSVFSHFGCSMMLITRWKGRIFQFRRFMNWSFFFLNTMNERFFQYCTSFMKYIRQYLELPVWFQSWALKLCWEGHSIRFCSNTPIKPSQRFPNPLSDEAMKYQLSSCNNCGTCGPNSDAKERRRAERHCTVEIGVFCLLSKIRKGIVLKSRVESLSCHVLFFKNVPITSFFGTTPQTITKGPLFATWLTLFGCSSPHTGQGCLLAN